jgi:hypothetical protein
MHSFTPLLKKAAQRVAEFVSEAQASVLEESKTHASQSPVQYGDIIPFARMMADVRKVAQSSSQLFTPPVIAEPEKPVIKEATCSLAHALCHDSLGNLGLWPSAFGSSLPTASFTFPSQKICLSPFVYDVGFGATLGVATAVIQVPIFTPIDAYHSLRQSGVDHKAAVGTIQTKPFLGMGYVLKKSTLRNACVYPSFPLVTDLLQDNGFSFCVSKITGGLALAGLESRWMAKDNVVRFKQQVNRLSLDVAETAVTLQDVNLARHGLFLRNGIYWAIFPLLADRIEAGLNHLSDKQLNTAEKGIEGMIAGSAAGIITALVSYPADVHLKAKMANPNSPSPVAPKNVIQYCREHGMWKTMTNVTHRAGSFAIGRMVISSGLFQVSKDLIEGTYGSVATKDVAHDGCKNSR